MIFFSGSEVKASACNAGDLGSIPGSGRSRGEGNGNSFQCSCLENPMDGGAWWATVHRVAKSRTWLSDFTFTFTTTSWNRAVFFSATHKNLFFTVKLAPRLWESSPEMVLLGSVTLPSPCVALPSWPHPPPPQGTCDKSEASEVFGVWSSHYHTVCKCSLLLKMAPQTLLSCFRAQKSDKELPQLFGFFGRFWVRQLCSGEGGWTI